MLIYKYDYIDMGSLTESVMISGTWKNIFLPGAFLLNDEKINLNRLFDFEWDIIETNRGFICQLKDSYKSTNWRCFNDEKLKFKIWKAHHTNFRNICLCSIFVDNLFSGKMV